MPRPLGLRHLTFPPDGERRRRSLEQSAAEGDAQYKRELLRELERRETEYHRLRRQRKRIGDFEPLTIIGRGAFGEVRTHAFALRHHLASATVSV